MQLDRDWSVAKTIFTSSCEKRGIPVYNKAVAIHTMLDLLEDDPDDEQIWDLLFIACADCELFITQFASYIGDEADEAYGEMRKEYEKLKALYVEQGHLEDTFSDYAADESLIAVDAAARHEEREAFAGEAEALAQLMNKCLSPGEEISDTLQGNLCGVLAAVRRDDFLKRCLPLILFLVMTGKENGLRTDASFAFSLSEIFAYRTFDINTKKKNHVKRLMSYTKLYRKLCKYYKNEEGVDKRQCRYGFFATSDLARFSMEEEFDKCKKLCPPLLYELLFADVSCQESEEPDGWDAQRLFEVSDELLEEYYDYDGDTSYQECNADDAARDYITAHPKVLPPFMKAVYHDKDEAVRIADEVFEKAVRKDAAKPRYKNAARMETYLMLMQELDSYTEQRLYGACMR